MDSDEFNAFRKKIHQTEKQARKDKIPFLPLLNTDLTPFMNLFVNPVRQSLRLILQTHLEVAQSLATSADKSGAERLWDKEAGEQASQLLTELLNFADLVGDIDPITYPAFLTEVLNTVTVRPKYGMHPRLDILGPIEARLQQPDVVIVAGMNEDTFPQLPQTDAWVNRPMRQSCGLPDPEEKIGVAAQDFMHLMQAPNVVLTRSLKVDGKPTIPSRWWQRLDAVLQSSKGISCPIQNEKFTPLLEKNEGFVPAPCPKANPDLNLRPTEISISDIVNLLNDPYIFYAKKILRLYKLDDLNAPVRPFQFGDAVHAAFALYLKKNCQTIDELLEIGQTTFPNAGICLQENPFIWERFKRIAEWFVIQTSEDKPLRRLIECSARMNLPLTKTNMTITGRADRIDVFGKEVSVIDYKTGTPPNGAQVRHGYAPQLPLEALMVEKGCFEELKDDEYKVKNLVYWRLIGKSKGGEIKNVTPSPKDIFMSDFLEEMLGKMRYLLKQYQEKKTPYRAYPQNEQQAKYNDYAHLERLAEWQTKDGD